MLLSLSLVGTYIIQTTFKKQASEFKNIQV
jgi:hypothetical protein